MSTVRSPDPEHHRRVHPKHQEGKRTPPHTHTLTSQRDTHTTDRTQTHFSALFLAPACCDKDPKQLRREPGVRGRRWAPPQHRADPSAPLPSASHWAHPGAPAVSVCLCLSECGSLHSSQLSASLLQAWVAPVLCTGWGWGAFMSAEPPSPIIHHLEHKEL